MKEEKIFTGKVIGTELIATSIFGMNTYKISFKTGAAFLQISRKSTFDVTEGDILNFTGEFVNGLFVMEIIIDQSEIYNEKQKEMMYAQQEQEKMVMSAIRC